MNTQYEYIKNFYNNRKSQIVYVMGEKCVCCGYNKCHSALELHHLNPQEKDFTISDNVNKAWEKVKIELSKTILVCANCHREIHAGLIDVTNFKTSYIPERADEISKQIKQLKQKKLFYCKSCGAIITEKATYCQECYAKTQRRVERPSRDELKKDLRSMPMTQVGKKYGVTDNAIRKWCDYYGLPRKVSDIKTFSNEEWEKL